MELTEIRCCRICRGVSLVTVLDFGAREFTGVFPASPAEEVPVGELKLQLCQDCGLVQLANSFPPELMYGDNYGYRSGLNPSMVKHLTRTVQRLETRVPLSEGDVVLDIGSNDGTLLGAYEKTGLVRIGIDPTITKFSTYYEDNILQVPDFFTADRFDEISDTRASIVTSIAMFYDLEDPISFAKDIHHVLSENGLWHFEQSYMPWMLRSGAYDTVCHEHLEYYSLTTIKRVLDEAGLIIVDAATNAVNGGSISVSAARADGTWSCQSVLPAWLLEQEQRMEVHKAKTWGSFAANVESRQEDLLDLLTRLRDSGKSVLGLGASTKGNVLLQTTGIGPGLLSAVGDINPYKFGRFLPGTQIPIISEKDALDLKPDYLLVLPWHFRETFMASLEPYLAQGGRLIFPLPELEVVGY